MRYPTGFSVALLLYALPAAANAASCEGYVGQTLAPQTFDAAVAQVAAIPARGKGETAAQFNSRKAAAMASASGPLIIAKEPEGQEYLQFDAAAHKLGIIEYAFHNKYFNVKNAFSAVGYSGISSETGTDYMSVIEQTEKDVGNPSPGNSSGAKQVGKMQLTSKVIYERPAPYREDDWVVHLFPSAAPEPHVVGALPMTLAEATALKPHLKLAFVVEPKAPFFISGRLKYRAIPHLVEVDIAEDFQVLVADFQCGLLLTDAGKVLGAYPTE